MIPIREADRKYLHFATHSRLFQFNCLPFSLSSAPRVFTKTLKLVATLVTELGVRLVISIDDILITVETECLAREHTQALIVLLEALGFIVFIVHPVKTIKTPAQEIEFLGLKILSLAQELQLQERK